MFFVNVGAALALGQVVTLGSLFREAWDLTTLCEYPDPAYFTRQASSYDRASVSPGQDSWFANKDWGNFVRDDVTNGRTEHVLADLQGPGCLVRYWSPNPAGITRVYVDGSPTPLIEAKTADLLSGKVPPFVPPVAEVTARGWSLYCPVTYQRSLRLTVDDTDNDAGKNMYYQVQYRTYESNVAVEPFAVSAVSQARLAERLSNPGRSFQVLKSETQTLAPGDRLSITNQTGMGMATYLLVSIPPETAKNWTDPNAVHNLLRGLRVLGTFDDELCIDAPLGDLMGTPIGLAPMTSRPSSVGGPRMVLEFPMPFERSAKFELVNTGRGTVVPTMTVNWAKHDWSDRTMHFKVQWKAFQGRSRPMVDLDFLHATGTGVFVGCNAAVSNPVPDWWGEGDEKIFLDDESFPSTFGTGTEDYFGYGWCDPTLFNHPYHYQSRCDGPGNKGHTSVGRWQILDRMPFSRKFQFDMELWHWADCVLTYGRTAFWYAKPGGSPPDSDSGASHLPPFIPGATKIQGALEGEELTYSTTGGTTEIQSFGGLSGGKQLWWRDGSPQHELRLSVPVAKSGRYRVFGRFCVAGDYGVHDISFGTISRQIDFYGKLGWKTIDLGTTILDASKSVPFRVWVHGANPKAEKRHMFGLDYLLLVPED